MAPPAADRRFAGVRRLAGLLSPLPGRAEYAVRLTLVCALTTLVVEFYQTPEPALTIYVAFFVVKADRTSSVLVSIVFMLLITIVLLAVLLLSTVVLDRPLWRVAAIALLSFVLLFAASSSKLKPVGSIIALIAGYALDVLGMAHVGEIVTRALLYAWLFVVIPAAISVAVNLLIGPAPRRLAERALAHRLRLGAIVLRDPADKRRGAFDACLREGVDEILEWLKSAGAERTAKADVLASRAEAARDVCPLLSLIGVVITTGGVGSAAGRALAACLEDLAGRLERGLCPVGVEIVGEAGPGASPEAAAAFAEIRNILTAFAQVPAPAPPRADAPAAGFFSPNAFTDPVHVQYALKTTAAAMLCYVTFTLLDWPGIHTSFITCYIVALGTTAETVEKLVLRIAGCLVGAALGLGAIVWVMPDVTSIGGLIAIVAGIAIISGWIAGGSPRISYVGFQLAFAFLLCVVQGPRPEFDLTIARDRVIGILFGDLVVALIFTQLWPVTVARRIDPAIAAVLRKLAALGAEETRRKRWALIAEIQAALGAIGQDLALASYEPARIRPSRIWTNSRACIVDAIGLCQGVVLLDGTPEQPAGIDTARRLSRLADAIDGSASASDAAARRSRSAAIGGAETDPPCSAEIALERLEHAVDATRDDAAETRARRATR